MEQAQYDYTAAAERIKNLRRRVIAANDGQSVEGLTPLEDIKEKPVRKGKSAQKVQEIN